MQGLVPPLLLVSMLLVFWLLVVRPGVRRERQRRSMQSALTIGDRIVLTSGIFGTVRAVHDDRLDIEVAPGTTISVALGAVGGLAPDEQLDTDPIDKSETTDTGNPTTPPSLTKPESEEN